MIDDGKRSEGTETGLVQGYIKNLRALCTA